MRRYTTAAVYNGTEQLEAHTYTLQVPGWGGCCQNKHEADATFSLLLLTHASV